MPISSNVQKIFNRKLKDMKDGKLTSLDIKAILKEQFQSPTHKMVTNPVTGKEIFLQAALSYPENHPVYLAAKQELDNQ